MDIFDVMYPPSTDGGWQRWGSNTATILTPAAAPNYGVDPVAAEALVDAADWYAHKLRIATAPATIGRYDTQLKNDALTALKAAAKPIVAILRTNPAVTDAQRTQLGIRNRTSPTPAPLPGRAEVTAMLTGPTSVRVIVSDPLSPSRRGKPRGVRAVAVRAVLTTGEDRPPADPAQWPLAQLSGRATVDLFWPAMSAETTVWVCCAWVNSRMEHGEASVCATVRLPGTGLSSRASVAAGPTIKIAA